jgi:hypothetical protein
LLQQDGNFGIAINIMDSPDVVLSRTVAPACLPPASADPDQYVDQDAILLGWGEPGNKRSETHCRLFFNDLT